MLTKVTGGVFDSKNNIEYLQNILKHADKLRPSEASDSGFYGVNEDIGKTFLEDVTSLSFLGISFEKFSEIVKTVFQENKIDEVVFSGSQRDPFGGNSVAGKDLLINGKYTNETYSEMLPHLIKNHHLFEGKDVTYRLEPLLFVLNHIDFFKSHINKTEQEIIQQYLMQLKSDVSRSDISSRYKILFIKQADFSQGNFFYERFDSIKTILEHMHLFKNNEIEKRLDLTILLDKINNELKVQESALESIEKQNHEIENKKPWWPGVISKSEFLKKFGSDDLTWREFFIDPDSERLVFKPKIESVINLKVSDLDKRNWLLSITRRDIPNFYPTKREGTIITKNWNRAFVLLRQFFTEEKANEIILELQDRMKNQSKYDRTGGTKYYDFNDTHKIRVYFNISKKGEKKFLSQEVEKENKMFLSITYDRNRSIHESMTIPKDEISPIKLKLTKLKYSKLLVSRLLNKDKSDEKLFLDQLGDLYKEIILQGYFVSIRNNMTGLRP